MAYDSGYNIICWEISQADPPDPSKIREEDIIGVTVLLLTCSYLGQEFVRVGYYVNNDYDNEQLREEPPTKVQIDRVQRNILSDKPRVGSQSFPSISIQRIVRAESNPCHLIILLTQMEMENQQLHLSIIQGSRAQRVWMTRIFSFL